MGYKQNIKIWVIGTLFLWLFSAIMPAISIYVFQESDQISMNGTLEEEQQGEEKKEDHKKDWVSCQSIINYSTKTTPLLTNSYVVQKTYKSPTNVVVLPPPELL
ncbi:hypothetical protein OAG27_04270 [Flavobacteriaceae bacterium]|jgi:Na+/citrate or Na+/malate symporter|nr:hypothetical protein [Flavobacteriaceae bacterium]